MKDTQALSTIEALRKLGASVEEITALEPEGLPKEQDRREFKRPERYLKGLSPKEKRELPTVEEYIDTGSADLRSFKELLINAIEIVEDHGNGSVNVGTRDFYLGAKSGPTGGVQTYSPPTPDDDQYERPSKEETRRSFTEGYRTHFEIPVGSLRMNPGIEGPNTTQWSTLLQVGIRTDGHIWVTVECTIAGSLEISKTQYTSNPKKLMTLIGGEDIGDVSLLDLGYKLAGAETAVITRTTQSPDEALSYWTTERVGEGPARTANAHSKWNH